MSRYMGTFLKLNKQVKYATRQSACFDIEADEFKVIQPGETKLISTGLYLTECPYNLKLQIFSRSGLSLRGITVHNAPGQIDPDYREEIKVILHNSGKDAFTVERGMRIAQAAPAFIINIDNAVFADEERNGGMGSTGV